MRNTYTTPADFWQERDFGTKISAVFEFIGQHWRPLGKCLVYFVLPAALVLGIGLGLFTNSFYNQMGGVMAAKRGSFAAPQAAGSFAGISFVGLGVAMLGGLVSFILLTGTLFGYLRARLRLPATETVPPAAVWHELKGRLGKMVLVLVLAFGAYLGLLMAYGFLIALVGGLGSSGSLGTFFISSLLMTVLGLYLAVVLSLYFPVLWLEDQSVLGAVGRCFQLIKGKWWSTCGLLLVAGLLQGVLAVVVALPQYAVVVGKMLQLPGLDSNALGLAAQCLQAVGIMFFYCIPLLALAFQYFSLAERQEGHGLRLLVDQLGQPQAAPTAYSAHYRPDEEGEY